MTVKELAKMDESLWDSFVQKKTDATFYHQIAWRRLIENVYGDKFKPIYLVAKDDGQINGILPLFLSNHWLFGKKLISSPFAIFGGCCADSESIEDKLITKAIELCDNLDADYLELRTINPKRNDLLSNSNYNTLILELTDDPQRLWKNFRKGIKQSVKTAEKNNVKVDLDFQNIDEFYAIYSQGQRNLGTPVQSYTWIKNLYDEFKDCHSMAVAYNQDKVIAVQFIRKFKDTVSSVLAYALPEYKNLCPNHILIWKLIKNACKEGYKQFDFGRSLPDSSTFYFKTGWRAQPIQLHYQFYLNKIKTIPDTSQTNTKRQQLTKIWKKLPLSVANSFGPIIRNCFP